MDPIPDKEARIEELLKLIAGCEIAQRDAVAMDDWTFQKTLEPIKLKYMRKLRSVVYGLSEEEPRSQSSSK